jgi:protein TonB
LDEDALRVASVIQFSAARNRDQQVAVWIQIPITFTVDFESGQADSMTFTRQPPEAGSSVSVESVNERQSENSTGADARVDRRTEPTFTPFTVAPEVRNRQAVGRALEREYPPVLRDAGVGGTVLMYFFIDESGVVRDYRVHESSGHNALDEAALRVASVIQFSAARNRDQQVAVWIQIPITFTTR